MRYFNIYIIEQNCLLKLKAQLFLVCLLSISLAYSQNITFDQAQNLRKKSLASVEAFLTTKGWSMTDAQGATYESMGKATFGYNVDLFDSEKAAGWIIFFESSISSNYNRLSIQVHKQSLYSTFLTRLAPNGYKLKSSKIEDGAIKKVYANTTTTCIVTTATSEGMYTKNTIYDFFFIDNFSYKTNFGKD